MSIKTIASIAIAAASLVALQAGAADLSNPEASRAEQLRHTHQSVALATVQPSTGAAANDFLQEAERGEYMRSAAIGQRSAAAQHATAFDALSPAEATRSAL